MYFFLLKKLFTAEDSFGQKPDYIVFRKCFDLDPKAYYFNVTGERIVCCKRHLEGDKKTSIQI